MRQSVNVSELRNGDVFTLSSFDALKYHLPGNYHVFKVNLTEFPGYAAIYVGGSNKPMLLPPTLLVRVSPPRL